MNRSDLPIPVAKLVDHLMALPGVEAVTQRNPNVPDRSPDRPGWDLAVYYRGGFDPEGLSHLPGTVAAPGAWGRIMNGGAHLTVEGLPVTVHYRNLADVERWTGEARSGRFEVDGHHDFVAGLPTYTLAAEVALGKVLAGSLEPVAYPDGLASAGAQRWRQQARASLDHADGRASRGDAEGVLHHLARASFQEAQARLCEARRWTINEKEILERAELTHLTQILTALKTDPVTLLQRVMQARTLLFD